MNRMFSRFAAAAVALMCFMNFIPSISAKSSLPFKDISTSYAKEAIIHLYNKGILAGTAPSIFSPKQSVTRAEFITILNRLLGIEPVNGPISPFYDVPKKSWYYGSVQAAVQLGIADGTSVNTFAPKKSITRQETAVLIVRAMKQADSWSGINPVFNDTGDIAEWAIDSVVIIQELGLMKGDENGKFRPNDSLTRQEAAVMINRVLQNSKWAAALEKSSSERIQLGWQYGQTSAQFEQTVLKSNVNTISPRWYFAGKSGAITDNTDQALLTWAHKHNKKVWAMVGNRSDQELTHQILSNATARNTMVNNLTKLVQKYDLDGLNIDYENVAPQDRAGMTAFITSLSAKLDALGVVLSVNVSPDLGTDWTDAFNYEALGKQADYIIMMGYDEHWGGSPQAGSVSSLPFVVNAINKLLRVVPASKTILALPSYNRDWALNSAGGAVSSDVLSIVRQNELILSYGMKPLWNANIGQYTTSYKKNGVQHRIWIEDGRSLAGKYKAAVNNNLAGLAYWYVGGESLDIWTSLHNAERYYGLPL